MRIKLLLGKGKAGDDKTYELYIEKWPDVPNGLSDNDKIYEVKYENKVITVSPGENEFDGLIEKKPQTNSGT